jgi:adenine-specific DNA-methyltransferase
MLAHVIKYLGSKRVLVPAIGAAASVLVVRAGAASACDPFTGTTRVAQELKRRGLSVHANDTAAYAECFARTYVATDANVADHRRLAELVAHLNALEGVPGYVTSTWAEQSRFFQPHNAARIDVIRAEIERVAENEIERAILLTSLIEAADRVDSTTGVQMAYLKQWAPRSARPLELRVPELVAGTGSASSLDAALLGRRLTEPDLVYLDPPYNQHSYMANYHVWETLARGDEPDVYGRACKRTDIRAVPSAYNSRRTAAAAFEDLLQRIHAPWVLVSFSNEGFLPRELIERMLGADGRCVGVLAVPSRRYVGARIGIHDPSGKRVGTVSHVTNTEFLFLAGPDREVVDAALAAAARMLSSAGPAQLALPTP